MSVATPQSMSLAVTAIEAEHICPAAWHSPRAVRPEPCPLLPFLGKVQSGSRPTLSKGLLAFGGHCGPWEGLPPEPGRVSCQCSPAGPLPRPSTPYPVGLALC